MRTGLGWQRRGKKSGETESACREAWNLPRVGLPQHPLFPQPLYGSSLHVNSKHSHKALSKARFPQSETCESIVYGRHGPRLEPLRFTFCAGPGSSSFVVLLKEKTQKEMI